jgi:hypothetical protein
VGWAKKYRKGLALIYLKTSRSRWSKHLLSNLRKKKKRKKGKGKRKKNRKTK